MSLRVEFTDVADMEAQDAFLWYLGRAPDAAAQWQRGLEEAVMSLADLPRRCKIAPEQPSFSVEIRQLLYGHYRILFTILDADGDGDEDTVRILHVRHASRRRLGETESE